MVFPEGKRLYINVNKRNVTGDIPMIIESDITFPLSSSFSPLLGGGNSKLINILGQLNSAVGGKGFSGQFKAMGIQVWDKTEPLTMSMTIAFYMNKIKPDGFLQVYKPSMELAKLVLPTEGEHLGVLVAPGPDFHSALAGEKKGANGKVMSLQIGKILHISSIIVTKAEPTFSAETDENGYPIWSKVSLEVKSVNTATQSMFPINDTRTTTSLLGR